MTNLRALACGRACQVRAPCCNGNTETTVLAHYRMADLSGAGVKSPDLFGAWACSACHDYVDARTHPNSDPIVREYDHLQGMVRTLAILLDEGVISVPEVKHRAPKLTKIFRRPV